MMDAFKELLAEMEDLVSRMQERGKEVFAEYSKKLFQDHPDLVSFSWTQYTPYFNDGDACHFGVNSYLNVCFSNGDEMEDWEIGYSRKYAEGFSEDHMVAADRAHELVSGVPEEVMEKLFGDHVEVTVYSDRVEIEDYYHD